MNGFTSKSLLGLIAGMLISPALFAADMATPSQGVVWANEQLGLAVPGDLAMGGSIWVQLGEEYAIDDIITLTFTGDALDNSTTRSSVTAACGGGFAGLTLGRLGNTPGEVSYRVTARDETCGDNTTIGQTLIFADFFELMYDAQAVDANNGVNVTYQAQTSGGFIFDSTGPNVSEDTIVTATFLDYEVAPGFSATIDVNTQRTTLIPGPADSASLNWIPFVNPDPTAACCATPFFAGGFAHEVVWSGDFSWIIDTDENAADVQPGAGVVTVGSCDVGSVVVTATTVTADCSLTNATLTLDPSAQGGLPDGLQTLPAGGFMAKVTAEYSDNYFGTAATGTSMFANLDAGAWGLNGFQALLPYMPYGSGIGQVIYLANRGTQDGAVSVDWIDQNGNSGSISNVATVMAGSTLRLGPAIQAALPEAQQTGGRLALTITANIPAADGQINSQYNVSGDRAFVIAETN